MLLLLYVDRIFPFPYPPRELYLQHIRFIFVHFSIFIFRSPALFSRQRLFLPPLLTKKKKVIDIYVWIILGLFRIIIPALFICIFPNSRLKSQQLNKHRKKSATACVNSFSLLTRLNNVSGQDSCRRRAGIFRNGFMH